MQLVFLDTEFTGLVVDPALISIGLVDETGQRTFYAELTDTWCLEDAGDFVRAAVLPLLEGGGALMTMAELQAGLRAWIEAFGEPVRLATDSLSWDWPWISEIFHEDGTWPANLVRKPLLVTPTDDGSLASFNLAVEAGYSGGLRRHHALDDAQANRLGWLSRTPRLTLFLDFDGVLHPAGVREDSYLVDMPSLAMVLRRFASSLQVVVSSSWREYESIEQLRGYFDQDLAYLVVDATPTLPGQNRQAECLAWMKAHAPGGLWLAIDDDAKGFEIGFENLFLVPKTGLEPHVAEALEARIAQILLTS